MDINKAVDLAASLMTQHGVGHVTFELNRGKNRLGVCHHIGVKNADGRIIRIPSKIGLSKYYVALLPEHEVRDVILHEIAHALALGKGERGHGQTWKTIAALIGAKPERCASPSAAPEFSVKGWCTKCERVCMEMHRLPLRVYWHRNCGKGKQDALVWFKNGTKVPFNEMPKRYRDEFTHGKIVRRKTEPKTLQDFFSF